MQTPTSGPVQPPARGRRAEYAEATRRAILDAARQELAEHGYVATRVDAVAARARVAPATVYAVSGGKAALLRAWVDAWLASPDLRPAYRAVAQEQDARAVLPLSASLVGAHQERWHDVIRVLREAAPHDPAARTLLARGTADFRAALRVVAARLDQLGALRPDVGVDEAVDVLWFHLGFPAWEALVEDCGWPHERAARWLARSAGAALLHP